MSCGISGSVSSVMELLNLMSAIVDQPEFLVFQGIFSRIYPDISACHNLGVPYYSQPEKINPYSKYPAISQNSSCQIFHSSISEVVIFLSDDQFCIFSQNW